MNSIWIKYVRQTNSHDALWLNFYNDCGHMKFYKEVSKSFIFSQPRSFDVAQWWTTSGGSSCFSSSPFSSSSSLSVFFFFFSCCCLTPAAASCVLPVRHPHFLSHQLRCRVSSLTLLTSSSSSSSTKITPFVFWARSLTSWCHPPPTRSHPGQLLGDGALV